MQGHRDLLEVARLILGELTPLASAQYGAIYLASEARRPRRAAAGIHAGSPPMDLTKGGLITSGQGRGWSARQPSSASRS